MPFVDAKGRIWQPRVTLGVLREWERALEVPILSSLAAPDKLRAEILGRVEVVSKGLYFAVRPEVERRGVSYEEFCDAISGPAIGAATTAFYAALVECFPLVEAQDESRPTMSRPPRASGPSEWDSWATEARRRLPPALTEADIQERWQEWEKKHGEA